MMSLISILSSGSFLQIFRMKSLPSSLTSTYSGNLISSSTWGGKGYYPV